MTRNALENSAAVRRLGSRITIGIAALAIVVGVSVTAPATASARYAATSSADVAADATHALWLLVRWEDTGDLADYTAYLQARLEAAQSTSVELGLSAAQIDAEWGAVDVPKQHALLSAMSQIGVPYRSRMSKPGRGFDCSGLVLFAYGQAGIGLPRSSRDQIRAAAQIDRVALEPGDLVYYPGHISMYLGDDFVIHSPQPGQEVEVREMFDRSLRYGDAVDAQP
ncbi:MAG TPA: NlpC/P60 family protein [Ilumatobacter sp.]